MAWPDHSTCWNRIAPPHNYAALGTDRTGRGLQVGGGVSRPVLALPSVLSMCLCKLV